MSYASLGVGAILNILLPGEVSVFTDGLVVFNTPVPHKIAGKNFIESRIRQKTGCSVVAMKKDGSLLVGPDPKTLLTDDAELIIVGTAEAEVKFMAFAEN
jgi:K+/H+ antiporter YhaU regulatory subunit KhtT